MPHHYLHDDVLEEYSRDLKLSRKSKLMRCDRCGDPIRGEHYVGTDATVGVSDMAEGSGAEIRVCRHCYGKETGLNFGQYTPAYEP